MQIGAESFDSAQQTPVAGFVTGQRRKQMIYKGNQPAPLAVAPMYGRQQGVVKKSAYIIPVGIHEPRYIVLWMDGAGLNQTCRS